MINIGTVVNEIQVMALSEDGLDHASLLQLCRRPDRDAGRPRVSHSAPTPDYLTPGHIGPAMRTR